MEDDPSNPEERPRRSQPPAPLTLAAFAASVIAFLIVITGLFALLRYIDRH